MDTLKRIFGVLIFMPFIGCYSFIVGPLLMAVLIPGGVALLLLILGYKEGVLVLINAFKSEAKVNEG